MVKFIIAKNKTKRHGQNHVFFSLKKTLNESLKSYTSNNYSTVTVISLDTVLSLLSLVLTSTV